MDSLSADVARGHEGFTAFYDAEVIGQVRSATLIVGSRTAAQDVVHDAFIALLSRWSELDEPGPYLQRAVVNGCRDLLRRRSVAHRFAHRLAPPADVAAVDADLFDALARLRFNHRAAIVLRFYLQLSENEIADRIDVDLQLEDLLSPGRALQRPPPARSRMPRILAAACLVLFAGLALVLSTGRNPQVPAAETAPIWTPPRSLPGDAPEPGAFAAHVANPPAWLGELGPGLRTGALRSGRWVAAAIARPTADGFVAPITVSAFDGTWEALGGASTVEIDGRSFLRAQIGDWQALTTTTRPHIAAAGNVDQHTLHDVLSATRTTSHQDRFTITISTMPDGYVELVPPHALPADTTPRRTLAETGGALAINEVSDWADPLLYAASTGADITGYALDTTTGWSGTSTSSPYGTITFVVWSPRPGVLLEIDSTDPGRSIDDLVQLANDTSVIPATEWDDTYPG